jgi:hypothetical protein
VILYELLTGSTPIERATFKQGARLASRNANEAFGRDSFAGDGLPFSRRIQQPIKRYEQDGSLGLCRVSGAPELERVPG